LNVGVAKYSGLRKTELRRLTWEDVDFLKNALRVRQTKNKTTFEKPMPKKLRQTLLVLRNRFPFARHVFCNPDSSPCGDWKKSFNNACKRAGLNDVCFYMLRHSCFSNLGNNGYGLLQLKAYTGHKSTRMVERYTKISPEYVQKMANALDLDDD
jgi:integrase